MYNVSSTIRVGSLQSVFGHGLSPHLDRLAQLSVLYEDLRIETFALTANEEELKRLDYMDFRYRIHYFLRRSVATLLEFRGALIALSRTDGYKAAKAIRKNKAEDKPLFNMLASALKFFEDHHRLLKDLRNAVGGHFSDEAAQYATAHLRADATGKFHFKFDHSRKGAGPMLHYAGEIAAVAFTKVFPRVKSQQEETEDVIRTIRDGYEHATNAMHGLILLFLWDRFG